MSNDFFNPSGAPAFGSPGVSQVVRDEFASIAQGFDKMPTLAGNDGKLVKVNAAGNGLTVGNAPEVKYAAADQSISSSTTFTDDAHLVGFTLMAGGVYAVEGILIFETTDLDPDVKLTFIASETPAFHAVKTLYADANNSNNPDSVITGPGTTAERLGLSTERNIMLISGVVQANASNNGTWKLQWAQYASDVNAVVRKAGSFLQLTRLA